MLTPPPATRGMEIKFDQLEVDCWVRNLNHFLLRRMCLTLFSPKSQSTTGLAPRWPVAAHQKMGWGTARRSSMFKAFFKTIPGAYIYMGVALKTVWIVPRWSGRLERGGYVKGHDPEVSKAPTRRSCCHDMTSYLYMSLWLGQRSHGKAERSRYTVHTLDSNWL